jgi:O-methyltransferase
MRLVEWAKLVGTGARNALLAGNVLSLSLVTEPRTFYRYLGCCFFMYKRIADRGGIPQRHVFSNYPDGDLAITLPRPSAENASCMRWFGVVLYYAVDIMSLCLLCRFVGPRRIFEIGTFDGYSATAMAMNSPPDAVVYTLDLPCGARGEPTEHGRGREIRYRPAGAGAHGLGGYAC